VINKRFNETMQKLSAKLSNGVPRRPPRSPPLISTPAYMFRIFPVPEINILLHFP